MSSKRTLDQIRSYADAAALLATARKGTSVKTLDKSTQLHKVGENIVARYYATDIVTWFPDNTFRLNNGGHTTRSTCDWMEVLAPVSIRTRQGKWEIMLADKTEWQPYIDGLTYRPLDAGSAYGAYVIASPAV